MDTLKLFSAPSFHATELPALAQQKKPRPEYSIGARGLLSIELHTEIV